jgi:hypothetical protein
LLWALEEMEGVCTKALNRLGGSWLVPHPRLALAKGAHELDFDGRS